MKRSEFVIETFVLLRQLFTLSVLNYFLFMHSDSWFVINKNCISNIKFLESAIVVISWTRLCFWSTSLESGHSNHIVKLTWNMCLHTLLSTAYLDLNTYFSSSMKTCTFMFLSETRFVLNILLILLDHEGHSYIIYQGISLFLQHVSIYHVRCNSTNLVKKSL